ncbi:1,4-alpha-glucan branching protein GlgB [Cuniculiplasma sp. SKW3]|uniref:1,4-alpha-glucan branching protein GlgB n=1 Tax=Cuniculiplasma sp. SKW3 TaxID=3400170 RepID=UPI003FD4F165
MIETSYFDPEIYLVPKRNGKTVEIKVSDPKATEVWVEYGKEKKNLRKNSNNIWYTKIDSDIDSAEHIIGKKFESGYISRRHNPYAFKPAIPQNISNYYTGADYRAFTYMGSHYLGYGGVGGFNFILYAPSAKGVSVIGDFNGWEPSVNPMFRIENTGFWSLFIPDIGENELYKFFIITQEGKTLVKSDPFGFSYELRPGTASKTHTSRFKWRDRKYLEKRFVFKVEKSPISVYEVHLGSWKRDENGNFLSYRELATRLSSYCKKLGFTHVELLPIMEHPLDDSWGYQTSGYFSPTSRHGDPDDFKEFVNIMHSNDIGVILDWVPAHFPRDESFLEHFDGTNLFEYSDPLKRDHPDWGTLIFDFGKRSTINFLISSASFWIEEYHADAIRIDAVSSMLYLDYSRRDGKWRPNIYGGNENLEAISFIRELNNHIEKSYPGSFTVAEESTSWNGVTKRVDQGGLGFSLKWNMGWMHDILEYISLDPIYRKYHHNQLTFIFWYGFSENYILPLSHDEVVYGKRSIYHKMPGDPWQKLANVRLLFSFMFSFPGKKLMFMGDEIPAGEEWDFHSKDSLRENAEVKGEFIPDLIRDLNYIYRNSQCLYEHDFDSSSFGWIDYSDRDQSIICYYRRDVKNLFLFVMNFTPVPRRSYRIGVPEIGKYRVVLNTDSEKYGGSGFGSSGDIEAEKIPYHGRDFSLELDLPPLGAVYLRRLL